MSGQQSTFVKVCGLTEEQQIDWALELGYDAIGIVVTPRSKRYCPPEQAVRLAGYARGRIPVFAVALTYAETAEVAEHFDTVQIYETADIPNLALAAGTPPERPEALQYFFYDASAGSGVFADIPAWVAGVPGKVVIAGGLDEHNVAGVFEAFGPYGVDVSSSVETAPGVKSRAKMASFVAAARTSGRAGPAAVR
jgi:phosphoribosylanthranilate isomerase